MFSSAANSVWQSSTLNNPSGSWSQVQINITAAPYKFNVNTAATSSTTLAIHDGINNLGINIQANDPLLLSNNGTTLTQGTAGSITLSNATTYWSGDVGSSTIPGPVGWVTYGYGSWEMSKDGKNLYVTNKTAPYNIGQWPLSVPYDSSSYISTSPSATWTPPEAATDTSYYPITFKNDGTIIYIAKYVGSATFTVTAYALTKAWDLSTASNNPIGSVTLTTPRTGSNYWSGAYINAMKFSPDGTKLIVQNGQGLNSAAGLTNGFNSNLAIYTLSTPWNLSSATTTTTNFTAVASFNGSTNSNTGYYGAFDISADGKNIIIPSTENGGAFCRTAYDYIRIIQLTSAWTVSSGVNVINSFTIVNNQSTQGVYPVFANYNADGSKIYVSAYGISTYIGTTYASYTRGQTKSAIDITSFNFAASPNVAYYGIPSVNVQTSNTSSRINMYPREVYMNTASATTTTANLALYGSGVIAAGDTLLANGTTSITVSSVVESPLANVNIGLSAYNYYTTGKLKAVDNAYTNFVLSPDGINLVVGGLSPVRGLYLYKLSTPFDISTAVKTNIGVQTTASGFSNTNTVPFDITPDGKSLIICGDYITGGTPIAGAIAVYQYTLTQAWNIATAVFTGKQYSTSVSNSSYRAMIVKWGPLGNSILVGYCDDPSSGTTTTIAYRTLTVNYDLSTAANNGITSFVSAFGPSFSQYTSGIYFTPDGKKMLATGAGGSGTPPLMAFPITSANDISKISSTTTESFALTTFGLGFAANTTYGGVSASPDGTKLYVIPSTSSSIYQFNVLLSNTTNYFVTYPTQSGKPSSMSIPDRSSKVTLTPSIVSGNILFTSAVTTGQANNLAIKITSPVIGMNVANVRINTWN